MSAMCADVSYTNRNINLNFQTVTLLKCNTSYIADNSALALSQDFIERSQNEIPYFGFSNNSEFLGIKREMFIIEKNAFLLIGCFWNKELWSFSTMQEFERSKF